MHGDRAPWLRVPGNMARWLRVSGDRAGWLKGEQDCHPVGETGSELKGVEGGDR